MAARKQARKDDDPPTAGDAIASDDFDEQQDGADDDLDMLIEQLTGEAEYIVLWRVDGPTAKSEHVDKIPLSRFNSEYVKDRHGGGDYLFRAYGEKIRGRGRRMAKYKEFSIDKSIAPKTGSAAAAWKEKFPVTAGYGPGQPVQPSRMPPWVETMLAATIPALAAGLVTMITREKQTDPLLLELIRSNNKGSGAAIDPIALQTLLADERARAIDIGKEIAGKRRGGSGSDDEEEGMWGAVTEGISTLKEFAIGYRQNAENEAKGIKPAATVEDDNANGDGSTAGNRGAVVNDEDAMARLQSGEGVSSPVTTGGAMRLWVAAASPYMGMLKLAKGMKPATAAQVIVDGLTDDAFNDLMSDVEDETNGGVLVRLPVYFPSLENANVDWVRAVIDEIRELAIFEPSPEEQTSAESETRRSENADGNTTDGNTTDG